MSRRRLVLHIREGHSVDLFTQQGTITIWIGPRNASGQKIAIDADASVRIERDDCSTRRPPTA